MDLYPFDRFHLDSIPMPDIGREVRKMMSGKRRIAAGYDQTYFDLTIVHSLITLAKFDQIVAFFDAHEGVEVQVDWPASGKSYVVQLVRWEPHKVTGGVLYGITVQATGTMI